jgi:hypothetical protein
VFVPVTHFNSSLIFLGKAGANPNGAPSGTIKYFTAELSALLALFTTLSIMSLFTTLSIMSLFMTLSITVFSVIMLSVTKLSVAMLSVAMLNVAFFIVMFFHYLKGAKHGSKLQPDLMQSKMIFLTVLTNSKILISHMPSWYQGITPSPEHYTWLACTIKLFTVAILNRNKLECFSLSVASYSFARGSIRVSSSLAMKYKTRLEVTDSGKHSSLRRNTSFIAQQGALLGKAPALTHHDMERITIGNKSRAQPFRGSDYSFCGFSSLGSDQYFFLPLSKTIQ